jgi:hypothetical protein
MRSMISMMIMIQFINKIMIELKRGIYLFYEYNRSIVSISGKIEK